MMCAGVPVLCACTSIWWTRSMRWKFSSSAKPNVSILIKLLVKYGKIREWKCCESRFYKFDGWQKWWKNKSFLYVAAERGGGRTRGREWVRRRMNTVFYCFVAKEEVNEWMYQRFTYAGIPGTRSTVPRPGTPTGHVGCRCLIDLWTFFCWNSMKAGKIDGGSTAMWSGWQTS